MTQSVVRKVWAPMSLYCQQGIVEVVLLSHCIVGALWKCFCSVVGFSGFCSVIGLPGHC